MKWQGKPVVYIDTEYSKDTSEIFWVGLTFDGINIFGCPFDYEFIPIIKRIMEDPRITKAAHNIPSDAAVLEANGIKMMGDWYCSMIGYHCLHPGTSVSLSHCARFYIDDVSEWKWMDVRDPKYNALDVLYGAQCMLEQWREIESRPVSPLSEILERMKLLKVCKRMKERGLLIDLAKRTSLDKDICTQLDVLREKVVRAVAPLWDRRVLHERQALYDATVVVDKVKGRLAGSCKKHPTYSGLRRPAICERCGDVQAQAVSLALPDEYTRARKARDKCKTQVKRWECGYDAGNPHHLQWLLYDADALNLPIQRQKKTRSMTGDAKAIEKLAGMKIVQRKKDAFAVVLDIKDVQHLEKAKSTFIDIPIDSNGYAHPPYKVHGTFTGRLAGGADKDEKSDNRYAYNVLNIPEEWRCMYVAPPGHVFVYADYSNQEGRLCAYYSGCAAYRKAFADEDAGGHKVHNMSAHIIYGIDPQDADTYKVMVKGVKRSAYFGGKVTNHSWAYSYMTIPTLMYNFGLSLDDAIEVDAKLSAARPGVVAYKPRLVSEVLGVWEPHQSSGNKWYANCIQQGKRVWSNAFGWTAQFLGHAGVKTRHDGVKVAVPHQANNVLAQPPQSTGGSIIARIIPVLEERWPVTTTTYDSAMLTVPHDATEVREAASALKSICEQPWSELDGLVLPVSIMIGSNWGEFDEKTGDNPSGLRAYEG